MSVTTIAQDETGRRGFPPARLPGAGAPPGVSAPQIMRLAILILLAASCAGFCAAPRGAHVDGERLRHALAAKAAR